MVSSIDSLHLSSPLSCKVNNETVKEAKDGNKKLKKQGRKSRNNSVDRKSAKGKLILPCQFCNEVFNRKDRLDRHIFTHTKEVSI
jgi:hypothetical protein